MTERRHRDPVGEVEVGATIGVEESMALAVAPLALEVSAEDRRQMGRGVQGRLHRRSVAAGLVTMRSGRVQRWPYPPDESGVIDRN